MITTVLQAGTGNTPWLGTAFNFSMYSMSSPIIMCYILINSYFNSTMVTP